MLLVNGSNLKQTIFFNRTVDNWNILRAHAVDYNIIETLRNPIRQLIEKKLITNPS